MRTREAHLIQGISGGFFDVDLNCVNDRSTVLISGGVLLP